MANEQLQQRAGRNWPPYLNAFFKQSWKYQKVEVKELIVMENPNDLRLMIQQFTFNAAVNVVNGSLSTIDAQLLLVDDQGNEALMDSDTIGGAGTVANLIAVTGFLAKNEKLLFRITSGASILDGTGVHLSAQSTIPPGPQTGSTTAVRQRVESTTVELDNVPGIIALTELFSVSNFGTDSGQSVTPVLVFEDGAEFPLATPIALPANAVTPIVFNLIVIQLFTQNVRLKFVFSNLPNNKYFVLNRDLLLPVNTF